MLLIMQNMTDKELKKLKKYEILEIMLYLKKELDEVKQKNEELKKQLNTLLEEKNSNTTISKENFEKIMSAVDKILKDN